MPHQENMNDVTNTNGHQIEIVSAKRVWSRPECRRLHISHETAGGDFTLNQEDGFPAGPEPS